MENQERATYLHTYNVPYNENSNKLPEEIITAIYKSDDHKKLYKYKQNKSDVTWATYRMKCTNMQSINLLCWLTKLN